MLLAIQIAASRLLREVPQAPFERTIASCGCAFFKRLWNTASSPLVVFFFLFGLLFLGAKQPVHIGLHSQQFPHFITGLPELAVGFLLFLQQLCVLGLQALDCRNLFQPQLVKGFFCRLMKQNIRFMLRQKILEYPALR